MMGRICVEVDSRYFYSGVVPTVFKAPLTKLEDHRKVTV